jgi:cell division protein ZapE
VKLFVGAEAAPDELFTEGENSAEFARTASRLVEMQSAHYLQSERVQR